MHLVLLLYSLFIVLFFRRLPGNKIILVQSGRLRL